MHGNSANAQPTPAHVYTPAWTQNECTRHSATGPAHAHLSTCAQPTPGRNSGVSDNGSTAGGTSAHCGWSIPTPAGNQALGLQAPDFANQHSEVAWAAVLRQHILHTSALGLSKTASIRWQAPMPRPAPCPTSRQRPSRIGSVHRPPLAADPLLLSVPPGSALQSSVGGRTSTGVPLNTLLLAASPCQWVRHTPANHCHVPTRGFLDVPALLPETSLL
jgi:hypothetical protein